MDIDYYYFYHSGENVLDMLEKGIAGCLHAIIITFQRLF